jgi:hypothetical protein
MAASRDRVHGADKKVGASGKRAGPSEKRVDAAIEKVDAATEKVDAAIEKGDASEQNGEWADEKAPWADHNVLSSDKKQEWSSVREPAVEEDDVRAGKNVGASTKKHLSTQKKALAAAEKWIMSRASTWRPPPEPRRHEEGEDTRFRATASAAE